MTTQYRLMWIVPTIAVLVLATSNVARAEGDLARSLKDTAPVFFESDTDRLAWAGQESVPVETAPVETEPDGPLGFFDNPEGYNGGRGLISLHGMSGMFINPTSGTLNQGQLTVQWCILYQGDVIGGPTGAPLGVEVLGNGVMAAYGITDWIEVGVYSVWAILDPSPFKGTGDDETLNVMGPFARIRVLKDEGWIPEVSIGGIWLDGDASSDLLARQEIFVAASKYFEIDPDGFFVGFRIHGGIRFIWKHDGFAGVEDNDVMGFIGGELELPYSIWVIAEVSTQSDTLGPRAPHAFGLQWRPNEIIGVTLGAVQPGDSKRLAFYFGIGFQYQF